MSGNAIFLPMLSTMTLTAVVWFYMYGKRIPAMRRAGVSVQTYTTPDKISEYLPEEVNFSANNFKNLFEVPTLYYGLCLYLFVSGNVDTTYVAAAWLFFLFRAMHSLVHCTSNIVMRQFYWYVAASFSMWIMLGRALIAEISVYI
ncbi:MAG: MAPEG family protein [Woeseiaceae bacterium]|nr:MAPEG family protein [Woeseiaceae bacterium]